MSRIYQQPKIASSFSKVVAKKETTKNENNMSDEITVNRVASNVKLFNNPSITHSTSMSPRVTTTTPLSPASKPTAGKSP